MHHTTSDPLLSSGDVFILDDLPAHSTVGCDATSLNSEKPFPGFREIPPGPHLIWVSQSESTSSRSGYWIYTPQKAHGEPGNVYVKQWSKFNEVLDDPASQAEERIQKERLGHIFDSLIPYDKTRDTTAEASSRSAFSHGDESPSAPLTKQAIWFRITFGITPGVLGRITGGEETMALAVHTTDTVLGETRLLEEARVYGTNPHHFRFLFPMDAHLVNPQAKGAELTRQALDPTGWIIDKVTAANVNCHLEDLVGEFQFAFITGMHLGNFSCLEQWWFLACRLLFRSYDLAVTQPELARQLIQTFHAQLLYNDSYLDGDVFEMMPEHSLKLQKVLTTYKAHLDEKLLALGDSCTPDQQAVGIAFSSLESWLWRLGWDLRGEYVRSGTLMLEDGEMVQAELSDFEEEDERGEFAPTVVEFENGKETGLF
ncbi:A1 cistron-splicing factor [Xylariaceae sp. FL1272]|nr:A1 cistron-splicing factor [Xylariaceae sp. FL1272]